MPGYYAGIGSRRTPAEILSLMRDIAACLAQAGWTLRSGGAEGADQAFEAGAGAGAREIYLPWRNFNGHASPLFDISQDALVLAAAFHPNWPALSPAARRLMARNGYQVLGADLQSPARFVLCWTPDGVVDGAGRSAATGGTGQAIAIAASRGIPVFNLQRPSHMQRLQDFIARRHKA